MIVLDTHIWLWWLNDEKSQLGEEWTGIISTSANTAISAISCFEVAWLERHGRIELPMTLADWFDKATTGSGTGQTHLKSFVFGSSPEFMGENGGPELPTALPTG